MRTKQNPSLLEEVNEMIAVLTASWNSATWNDFIGNFCIGYSYKKRAWERVKFNQWKIDMIIAYKIAEQEKIMLTNNNKQNGKFNGDF